jgi:hypothetical protein
MWNCTSRQDPTVSININQNKEETCKNIKKNRKPKSEKTDSNNDDNIKSKIMKSAKLIRNQEKRRIHQLQNHKDKLDFHLALLDQYILETLVSN